MALGVGLVEEALAAEQARLRLLANLPPAMLRKVQELREKNPELLLMIERAQGISLASALPALERHTTRREPVRRSLSIRRSELRDQEPAKRPKQLDLRDSEAFEAVKSEPKAEGLGIAKPRGPAITAPGWNEGGSSFGDLRPRKSPFSGAVLRSRRLRRIRAKGFGGGGPIPDALDLIEESPLGEFLNVIDGTDNVIDGTDNVVD
jgi:hypothetical protein